MAQAPTLKALGDFYGIAASVLRAPTESPA